MYRIIRGASIYAQLNPNFQVPMSTFSLRRSLCTLFYNLLSMQVRRKAGVCLFQQTVLERTKRVGGEIAYVLHLPSLLSTWTIVASIRNSKNHAFIRVNLRPSAVEISIYLFPLLTIQPLNCFPLIPPSTHSLPFL